MTDGQEQEYIITSAPSTSTDGSQLEDALSYATVTTEEGHDLPQVTGQFFCFCWMSFGTWELVISSCMM